jgi:DNA helicase-2/ATP-dependent DNA helicase PcrA
MDSSISDFVHELPEDLLEVIDRSGYDAGAAARRRSPSPGYRREPVAASPPESGRVFVPDPDADGSWTRAVGVRVYHAQFGRGVVVGQEGGGPDARLTVRFGGATVKKVLARYLTVIER